VYLYESGQCFLFILCFVFLRKEVYPRCIDVVFFAAICLLCIGSILFAVVLLDLL
jgi:hypothetical protein